MKTRTKIHLLLLVLLALSIISCAPSEVTSDSYGFLYGIWHGFVLPFAVIGKILGYDIGIYAVNNTGSLYWFGYLIGIAAFGKGGRSSYKKRKK